MKFQVNIDFEVEPKLTPQVNNMIKANLKNAIIEYSRSLRTIHPLNYRNISNIDVHKLTEE